MNDTRERAMSPREETKKTLKTSEERRNKRVDALLKNAAIKAALHRDRRSKPEKENASPRRKLA
jgi:hypothetical protein